jgi:hypothetical protein
MTSIMEHDMPLTQIRIERGQHGQFAPDAPIGHALADQMVAPVLVSAFLTPGGAADALVDYAKARRFACPLAEDILAEAARVLLETPRMKPS